MDNKPNPDPIPFVKIQEPKPCKEHPDCLTCTDSNCCSWYKWWCEETL